MGYENIIQEFSGRWCNILWSDWNINLWVCVCAYREGRSHWVVSKHVIYPEGDLLSVQVQTPHKPTHQPTHPNSPTPTSLFFIYAAIITIIHFSNYPPRKNKEHRLVFLCVLLLSKVNRCMMLSEFVWGANTHQYFSHAHLFVFCLGSKKRKVQEKRGKKKSRESWASFTTDLSSLWDLYITDP